MFSKLFLNLVMAEPKQVVMILLIILPENDCGSFLATSGGELIKFVKKDKVKLIRLPVHSKNPLLIILNTFNT